ncbi:MAG: glycosyltransferase [Acidobacteriota bacterium]
MDEAFDISVILCTYNRAAQLRQAIASIMAQDCPHLRFELIIVDNHSTDQTRQVCQSMMAQSPIPIRYFFEARQGVSYARNSAINLAKSEILAFFDDDVWVTPDWLATIKRRFDEHQDVDGIGGKVLPVWNCVTPGWLNPAQYAPLALQDYGDKSIQINASQPLCLVAANLAIRRQVFTRIGLFSPTLQRVENGIGSMEDHELHLRIWDAGFQEMYCPEMIVKTEVPGERLTKNYYRRWHQGHGHFYGLLRDREFERSIMRLFDVPMHLYKQTLVDLWGWGKNRLFGKADKAFASEIQLWFFMGFFKQRLMTSRAGVTLKKMREVFTSLYASPKPQRENPSIDE